ncbi:MAG TPA: glycosyltransferase family 4 protein [Planktothrix sp.]|jgi:glycogen(starch) synthase
MIQKRILMLAWEYPPHIVGGLARVVWAISRELVRNDCEVHVITADHPGTPEYEVDEAGVHVHRVKSQTDSSGQSWHIPNFALWDARLNFGMLQHAIRLHQEKPFDIVHAHDWLVADAAWVLKSFGLPLVSTIHATEYGRNNGIHNAESHYIDQVEWRLIYESAKVIVNSQHMLVELNEHFHVPTEKVTVIPNGIEPDKLLSTEEPAELRRQHRIGSGPVLLFVGRLVYEKGIQVLLSAMPRILERYPDTTLIIAGAGGYEQHLRDQARQAGIGQRVRFFGKANDADLRQLYAMANAVVVPSLYEPFGIVALEGMAAKVPVVVSDAGGLRDIVRHEHNGVTTYAGNSDSLAWGVLHCLSNPELSARLKEQARQTVLEQFTWEAIAARTLDVYEEVLAAPSTSNLLQLPTAAEETAA